MLVLTPHELNMGLLFYFSFLFSFWCPTSFACLMMFVSFIGNTTDATSGAGTDYLFDVHEFPRFLVRIVYGFVHYFCPLTFVISFLSFILSLLIISHWYSLGVSWLPKDKFFLNNKQSPSKINRTPDTCMWHLYHTVRTVLNKR